MTDVLKPAAIAANHRAWLAAGCLAALAVSIFAIPTVEMTLRSNLRDALRHTVDIEIYNRTVISTSYLRDGFVRRGLGGTLATLFTSSWSISTILFITVSLALSVTSLALTYKVVSQKKLNSGIAYFGAIIAVSPQTFWGWSLDPVRTDMLVIASIGFSALSYIIGRRHISVILLLVGMLVHETAIIFGVPLLITMMWSDYRVKRLGWRTAISMIALIAVGIFVLLALQHLYSVPSDIIAAHMRAQSPPNLNQNPEHLLWRDIAIYMTVTGSRGLTTAICSNLYFNPQYCFMAVASMFVIAVNFYIIRFPKFGLVIFCLVSLPPMMFMLIVANDTGRWLKLAILNMWLVQSFLLVRATVTPNLPRIRIAIGLSLLAILTFMGPSRYYVVNDALHALAVHTGFADAAKLDTWMDSCDPGWRSYVYGHAVKDGIPRS